MARCTMPGSGVVSFLSAVTIAGGVPAGCVSPGADTVAFVPPTRSGSRPTVAVRTAVLLIATVVVWVGVACGAGTGDEQNGPSARDSDAATAATLPPALRSVTTPSDTEPTASQSPPLSTSPDAAATQTSAEFSTGSPSTTAPVDRPGSTEAAAIDPTVASAADNGTDPPETSVPAATGPATTGPATAGPATAGPAATGPAQTGSATTEPGALGPATTGPAVPGTAPGATAAVAPVTTQSLAQTRLELTRVAALDSPIALAAQPGSGRRYVAGRGGQIWLLDRVDEGRDAAQTTRSADGDDAQAPRLVADIGERVSSGCENGLLGLAFSPDGTQLYLSYTDTARNSRIAVVPMVGEVPQTQRRRVLLALEQPACNHNGGHLAFGPDGQLWIGFGDGGGANDVFDQGQDRDTLLGAIVRIDPTPPSGKGYGIPADNPFAAGGGAPEVWAYGARNPWRFSFDRSSGDLWIGDVGQDRLEELHVLPAADGWTPGANLGWPLLEGHEPFRSRDADSASAPADAPDDLVAPVYTYGHDEGCSVTGGYVYRGTAIAPLQGTYVFGDYCTGTVWGLVRGPGGRPQRLDLGVSVPRNSLVSFGEDANGELYVLSATGDVFRIEPAQP